MCLLYPPVGVLLQLVAIQDINVSKKLFSHRQEKQTPQAIVHKVVVSEN